MSISHGVVRMTRHVRMHLSRLAGAWLLLTGLIVLSATAASAQTTTASLNGVVADPQQGRLSGVEGRFVFSQLPPGQYEVTAELSGFRRFRQADLTLRANQAADLTIVLEVGGIEDEVKV